MSIKTTQYIYDEKQTTTATHALDDKQEGRETDSCLEEGVAD